MVHLRSVVFFRPCENTQATPWRLGREPVRLGREVGQWQRLTPRNTAAWKIFQDSGRTLKSEIIKFITCDYDIVKRSSVIRRLLFFAAFGSFSCSELLLRKVWLAHRGLCPFRPLGTAREPARAAQCHRNSAIGPLPEVQDCTLDKW